MRYFSLLLPLVLLFGLQPATNYTYRGVVTDETGRPLIGASVLIEGTAKGTVTDINGRFHLNHADPRATLRITYTGYAEQQITVSGDQEIEVQMLPSSDLLQEVVVVGNGRGRGLLRSAFTGRRNRSAPAASPQRDLPSRESYAEIKENGFIATSDQHTSTFALDVDAASYSNVRRFLNEGSLPPGDAVRAEEMVNYFQYDYPAPSGERPFHVEAELAECPWLPGHQLLLVGLRGQSVAQAELPPANFVFLIDVSGSMGSADKLPLLVESLKMLTDNLREADQVAIVVYAGAAGLVLPPTSGANKAAINDALGRLQAGGSTAGAAGIQLAYQTAQENFIEGGNNRIILATDGDFNVGIASETELETLIEQKRESGIFLSVLGFGRGNLQDAKMQILADKGNGNHAYIDQLSEARKVLVSEFGGTLYTIAKDVKIQLEFNPEQVASYRLIGYENRLLENEDFRNDAKDAGELGAGHTITALYEIVPTPAADANDLTAFVRLRHKAPDANRAQEMQLEVPARANSFGQSSLNLRWASAVAEFAMLLRDSEHRGEASFEHNLQIARAARGLDPFGYRQEMIGLIEKARELRHATAASKE